MSFWESPCWLSRQWRMNFLSQKQERQYFRRQQWETAEGGENVPSGEINPWKYEGSKSSDSIESSHTSPSQAIGPYFLINVIPLTTDTLWGWDLNFSCDLANLITMALVWFCETWALRLLARRLSSRALLDALDCLFTSGAGHFQPWVHCCLSLCSEILDIVYFTRSSFLSHVSLPREARSNWTGSLFSVFFHK